MIADKKTLDKVRSNKDRRKVSTSPEVACERSFQKMAESTNIGFKNGTIGRIICSKRSGKFVFSFYKLKVLLPLSNMGKPTMKDIDAVSENGGNWRPL